MERQRRETEREPQLDLSEHLPKTTNPRTPTDRVGGWLAGKLAAWPAGWFPQSHFWNLSELPKPENLKKPM